MKYIFTISLLWISFNCFCQSDSEAFKTIKDFQIKLNGEYKDPAKSPLEAKALKKFKSHEFFPIDLKYRVSAKLVVTEEEKPFKMPTSTSRLPVYRKYGELHFTLNDVNYKLNVYQSLDLLKNEKYKNYLFLPFTDLTNAKTTYNGGRYIELYIPDGEEIILDFNQAYNPYCAYSDKYSCPIVPSENHLDVEINAGVKMKKK